MYIPVWVLILIVFWVLAELAEASRGADPGPVYDRNGLRRRKD